MSFSCKFEELDDATRDYLHDSRMRQGKGMAGLTILKGNSKPVWAFLLGPVIGIGLFVITLGSSKDAWAIAMLQTAGLILGGWFMLYAFRRWTAGRSQTYGGYFLLFDPLHVYDVQGENVTVIDLETVSGVVAVPVENGGSVHFDLGNGEQATITLSNHAQAVLVEEYYDAMAQLESREDDKWSNLTAAELGAAAKYYVEHEELPDNKEVLQLDVPTIPTEPAAEKKAGWGAGPIFLWMIAAGLLYGLLWLGNIPLQDDFAFTNAKNQGAPGLRAYLLDERNTRNRDEAKQLLSKMYDAPIAKIRGVSEAPLNPNSREGMVMILEALRTTDVPVVSLMVQNTNEAERASDTQISTTLADSLGQSIGVQLIQFASPPPGARAHITIKYTDLKNGEPIRVDVEFRLDPDEEAPGRVSSFAIPQQGEAGAGVGVPGMSTQFPADLARELVGEFRPAPVFNPDFS